METVIKPSTRIKYHDNEHMSIGKFYDRVRKNEYRRRMPESALAGKGKHIMCCEKLLKGSISSFLKLAGLSKK